MTTATIRPRVRVFLDQHETVQKDFIVLIQKMFLKTFRLTITRYPPEPQLPKSLAQTTVSRIIYITHFICRTRYPTASHCVYKHVNKYFDTTLS